MGYYFRMLGEQGPEAPGGAMSHVVGGNQVAGHALLAYPSAYGETGIHSFMVAENGRLAVAAEITSYDRGKPGQRRMDGA